LSDLLDRYLGFIALSQRRHQYLRDLPPMPASATHEHHGRAGVRDTVSSTAVAAVSTTIYDGSQQVQIPISGALTTPFRANIEISKK
jgi:hypothetical protein